MRGNLQQTPLSGRTTYRAAARTLIRQFYHDVRKHGVRGGVSRLAALQRDNLVVKAPLVLRRWSYRKPADWNTRTLAGKIAWRCRNPDPGVDYGVLIDKYRVKDIVEPRFETAQPYGVFSGAEQIDGADLPPTFVMKSTRDSNCSMLVVDGVFRGMNRTQRMAGEPADTGGLMRLAREWQTKHLRSPREVPYRFVEPRMLFEEYLDEVDYELQFFLFSGTCRITMILARRFDHTRGVRHRLYDQHWRRLAPGSAAFSSTYDHSPGETPRPDPEVFEKLRQLCHHIDHVRADFFVRAGRYYFGEFTFTHNAGKPSLLGRYEHALSRYWPEVTAV